MARKRKKKHHFIFSTPHKCAGSSDTQLTRPLRLGYPAPPLKHDGQSDKKKQKNKPYTPHLFYYSEEKKKQLAYFRETFFLFGASPCGTHWELDQNPGLQNYCSKLSVCTQQLTAFAMSARVSITVELTLKAFLRVLFDSQVPSLTPTARRSTR